MKQGKAKGVLPREHTGHRKHSHPNTRGNCTHGHHHMVNTEIRLILFFAAKGGEGLYSQQEKKKNKTKHLESTVAQIMNYLLQNSGLN